MVVDLPAPLGPMNPDTFPSGASKLTGIPEVTPLEYALYGLGWVIAVPGVL